MTYTYYYTMEYLPTRYMANENEWENRRAVWNFKDGNCCSAVMDRLVEIVKRITDGRTSDYVICFIPASTRYKTTTRFSSVSRELERRTGVRASMGAVTKTTDSESGHVAGKSSNPTADFCFDSSVFRGKKVILIDDVITRGRTFMETADKLLSRGAAEVTGLFVAKTVNPDWNQNAA